MWTLTAIGLVSREMRLGLGCCLVALIFTAAGAADIGILSVSPTSARVGERVSVRVEGYLGPKPWRPYPVVLVRRAKEPNRYRCGTHTICEPTRLSAAVERLPFYLVGTITRWKASTRLPDVGSARLDFRVPRLTPGVYVPMLVCASCARGARVSLIDTKGVLLRVS
jgi:hypothetical protein